MNTALSPYQESKKIKGLCLSLACRRKPQKGQYCCKCGKALWRQANPVHATYNNLKTNAKRRGKRFVITLEEFEKWVIVHDYMNGKGTGSYNKTIDCIKPELGYEYSNMQVLTNAQNIRKMHHDKKMMEKYGYIPSHDSVEYYDNDVGGTIEAPLPSAPF